MLTAATTGAPAAFAQVSSPTQLQECEHLEIPAAEDFDNQPLEPDAGENIAMLCLESDSLPGIGGTSNCLGANTTDAIYINRFPDLQSMPEFEDSGIVPTTDDLVALWVDRLVDSNQSSDIQIVNDTDLSEFTKIVTATYTWYSDAGTGFNPFDDFTANTDNLMMFVLSEDRNRGYIITNPLTLNNITIKQSTIRL